MLIVDASCLFEVVAGTSRSDPIRRRLAAEGDNAAPHVIDVEVFSTIRRELMRSKLDVTAASQAVSDLRDWPIERFGHGGMLDRAWELQPNVRGWDAMYVVLAEAFDATLITMDARLARASGPRCHIEVLGDDGEFR
jgi:predicted nucleic acid-binding protein